MAKSGGDWGYTTKRFSGRALGRIRKVVGAGRELERRGLVETCGLMAGPFTVLASFVLVLDRGLRHKSATSRHSRYPSVLAPGPCCRLSLEIAKESIRSAIWLACL